jgi:hypothetical protein
MDLVAGLVLLIGVLFGGEAQEPGAEIEKQFEVGARPIGVVDESGFFVPLLPGYREDFIPHVDRETAERALAADEISKALLIGRD